MWKQTEINLGRIPTKKPVTVEFKYIGDGVFKSATASCGCTTPKWDIEANSIVAIYTPKAVPTHLAMQGEKEYLSTKYINVDMLENGIHKPYTLTIEAKVFEV